MDCWLAGSAWPATVAELDQGRDKATKAERRAFTHNPHTNKGRRLKLPTKLIDEGSKA